MTSRSLVPMAIGQLILFLAWFLGGLWDSTQTVQFAAFSGRILVVLHCIFCWIAIYFVTCKTLLRALATSGVVLMVPLPVYVLLMLMGGINLANLLSIQLALALLIACGALIAFGLRRLLPAATPAAAAIFLVQFLPPFWIWSERGVLFAWLSLT